MTVAGSASSFLPRTCAVCKGKVSTAFCCTCGADAGGAKLPLVRASAAATAAMRGVNIGAGGAPGFWCFAHGAPVLGTLYWLFWFPLPPVSLGIMVYLFFNGNRVALQRRSYSGPDEFRKVERTWAVTGALLFIPTFIVMLVWFGTIFSFLIKSGAL
jgi:hypothetical protein